MVARAILAQRKFIAIGVIVVALLALFLGYWFEMGWYSGLVEFLNAHGGWTFVFLVGGTAVIGALAWVYRFPSNFIAFLFMIVMFIAALIFGGDITAIKA
ncbi:MAG: hypothetical protein LBV13_01220 [Methanomassiliicoccaceae archaeon]|jgi:hypothetical protein|nr:hypothetical protein [Methanomassiliicoccaceae archaeon]